MNDPIDFDDHDCNYASWPKERLDRETLKALSEGDALWGDDPSIRQYAPEPLADRQRKAFSEPNDFMEDQFQPRDNVIELFTPYSPPHEVRSAWRSFGQGCVTILIAALCLWMLVMLMAGINPVAMARAWWAA